MLFQILIVFITLLLLPGYFIYSLLTGRSHTKFDWLVKLLYSGTFILYIFLAGRWDWLSYYLRYVLLALFVVAAVISYRRVRDAPFFTPYNRRGRLKLDWPLIELLIFLGVLAYTLTGYFYPASPVRLAFPLQDGRYYIAHGGNNFLLNYHNTHEAQQFALDVVELNAAGARASGLYPDEWERYVIFGKTIYSPCDGTVIEGWMACRTTYPRPPIANIRPATM